MKKRVGNYALEHEIGKGAFGTVYKGIDERTNEPVAIKAVPIKSLSERLVIQLEREMRVLQSVNSPYIVKLLHVMRTANYVYLVMEYCGGGDLESFQRSQKSSEPYAKLPERLVKRWLLNLLSAFEELHARNILHRDLKLANVLLSHADPEVTVAKVADFGFARFVSGAMMAETVLGTPVFMAPEVLKHERYNFKVDVWSLGVMAYEMLVGRPAFIVYTMEQLLEVQHRPISVPAGAHLSPEATDLIDTMLRYDPSCRPNFGELRQHPFFADATNPVKDLAGFDIVEPERTEQERVATQQEGDEESQYRNAILSVEYKCQQEFTTTLRLAQKYSAAEGKVLIAYAIYWVMKGEIQRYFEELEALPPQYQQVQELREKVECIQRTLQAYQAAVETALKELQYRLTDEDLARSVLLFRDTGLYIEGRLFIQEAEHLYSGIESLDTPQQIDIVKDIVCLLSIASTDKSVEEAANGWIEKYLQWLKEVEGKVFKT